VSSITPFMVNYFKSLGATDAREFGIRTPSAQTYNDLMGYDVFFFRGATSLIITLVGKELP